MSILYIFLHLRYFTRRVDLDAGQEEAGVESILEELAQELHAFVGVRMHKLGVCEWEVKLWMASSGQANGAWRIVVTNVTGQTCTLHVSFYLVNTSASKILLRDLAIVLKYGRERGKSFLPLATFLVCRDIIHHSLQILMTAKKWLNCEEP